MILRSRTTRFFLLVTLLSLITISVFVSEFSGSIVSGTLLVQPLLTYSLIDLFLLELFVLLLAGTLLANGKFPFRSLLYLLTTVYILIYFLQTASIHVGREFLSWLALENADHLYLFLDFRFLIFFIAIGFTCLLLIYLTEKGASDHRRSHRIVMVPLLVTGIIVTLTSSFWLPSPVIEARDNHLTQNNLAHTSPVLSLYKTIWGQKVNYTEPLLHKTFRANELEEIGKFGFHYDPTAEYPLVKESIYNGTPPFPLNHGNEEVKPNVIVFFSEGLSARTIGVYNSIYPDLTPNINKFAKTSMTVHRYYNHTAATYRALHGQLASIFPFYGGHGGWHSDNPKASGRSYLSLAGLFNNAGYETIFLDSHHKDHPSQVDRMMTELGFTTVITGDQLATAYLKGERPLVDMAYSDHQYIREIIGFLKQRSNHGNQQSFFLSLYNFGTHAFLQTPRDAVLYKDGLNSSLNNFHTFDRAFGIFWDYLSTSPYAGNTILVFTADHCHYHQKTFVRAFQDNDYQQLFVDRIPLIIHDPLRLLPQNYDAENSSSIDFTPSMAHYLGLKNERNPFMGSSIFEPERKPYRQLSLAALGPKEIFLIDSERIHTLDDSHDYKFTLKVLSSYINLVRQLELEDRIWADDLDVAH